MGKERTRSAALAGHKLVPGISSDEMVGDGSPAVHFLSPSLARTELACMPRGSRILGAALQAQSASRRPENAHCNLAGTGRWPCTSPRGHDKDEGAPDVSTQAPRRVELGWQG